MIGDYCKIMDNVVLGKRPAKAKLSATTETGKEWKELHIGKGVTIGANSVIYTGSTLEDEVFIGDLASVREEVTVGSKTIIGRGATIENQVSIGKMCKIETEAYITNYSTIGDYCFVAPCVCFTNDNYVGRTEKRKQFFKAPTLKTGARIGANATLLPGVVVGEDALVAAGSVVTKNVEPRIIVAGNPARYLRDVPEEQLLSNQVYYEG